MQAIQPEQQECLRCTSIRRPPQVSVSWDNEEALNEKYYRADRTALITVDGAEL